MMPPEKVRGELSRKPNLRLFYCHPLEAYLSLAFGQHDPKP
jgi:hypothetical protein